MSRPDELPLPRIEALLREIEDDLRAHVRDPLYVIGSAAACLAGAQVSVADLDLFGSREDAARLETAWAARRIVEHHPADQQLFRSRFARYRFAAMPLEVMGGLELGRDGGWIPLRIEASLPLPGSILRLPSVDEQRRVLRLFGRPKDTHRIGLLDALTGVQS